MARLTLGQPPNEVDRHRAVRRFHGSRSQAVLAGF